MTNFARKLARLLNEEGWDNAVNMPDFILAELIERFICSLETAHMDHTRWADNENSDGEEQK